MKTNNSKQLLIIAIIWVVLVSILLGLFIEVKHQEKIAAQKKLEKEVPLFIPDDSDDEEEIIVPSLLEQSIAVCKNKYADRIAHAVLREHERHGIPIPVIYSLIGTESDKTKTSEISIINCGYFTPRAESHMNCRGLTQIHYDTLQDFNTFSKRGYTYTWDDMFDIDKNIEVGVWHYMRYVKYVGYDWVNLYIIYNAGYGNYTRENNYWIYNPMTLKWENHRSNWYYRNHKYPPKEAGLSFDDLDRFAPTKRFELYLKMYTELFA